MKHEHEEAGRLIERLREITKQLYSGRKLPALRTE
jgi:iron-sulfur cluster repair protein YtfE (RIC family)